jgi:hypothetical protein
VATPFFGEESKPVVANTMRFLMAETQAVRYTLATEAWMARGPLPAGDKRPVHERDDRVECVMIFGCDRDESKMAEFEIIRNWETGVVERLQPLSDQITEAQGLFLGLLGD